MFLRVRQRVASHPRFVMTGAFSMVWHLTFVVVLVSGRRDKGDGTRGDNGGGFIPVVVLLEYRIN